MLDQLTMRYLFKMLSSFDKSREFSNILPYPSLFKGKMA